MHIFWCRCAKSTYSKKKYEFHATPCRVRTHKSFELISVGMVSTLFRGAQCLEFGFTEPSFPYHSVFDCHCVLLLAFVVSSQTCVIHFLLCHMADICHYSTNSYDAAFVGSILHLLPTKRPGPTGLATLPGDRRSRRQ